MSQKYPLLLNRLELSQLVLTGDTTCMTAIRSWFSKI